MTIIVVIIRADISGAKIAVVACYRIASLGNTGHAEETTTTTTTTVVNVGLEINARAAAYAQANITANLVASSVVAGGSIRRSTATASRRITPRAALAAVG